MDKVQPLSIVKLVKTAVLVHLIYEVVWELHEWIEDTVVVNESANERGRFAEAIYCRNSTCILLG